MTGSVPPGARCTEPDCDRPAVNPDHPAGFCQTHHPVQADDGEKVNQQSDADTSDVLVKNEPGGGRQPEAESSGSNPTPDPGAGGWSVVNFAATTPETYPPTLLDRRQWMGRLADEKMPFSPWADRDHSDADPDNDARYKWGLTENYVTGEKAVRGATDPRLGGVVFIQREADPFAFVDGDDVRDPDTGDVHPEFVAILERLGVTYADVSTSGAGVHAYYKGGLPDNQGQAVFEIDTEPWGANDDPPTVEIYANKHVCVATGDHVEDTPEDVRPWDDDAVAAVLGEYDARKEPTTVEHDTDRDLDLDGYDPDATDAADTTTDIRDLLTAVDRLRPRDLPLRTRQVGTDATGWEKYDPSIYRPSSGNDSLHRPPGEAVFHDHKHGEAFGVLSLFAAEQEILSRPWKRLRGEDWWDAVDAAREAGAAIPKYVGPRGGGEAEHTAVLPTAVRDLTTAASGWDWQHAGQTGPDTLTIAGARERTTDAIADAYERGDRVLVEALPTMGKSYGAVKAAADTDEPVTIVTGRGRKEQYDQFKQWCDEHGVSCKELPAFTEDCPTAAGDHSEEWWETVMDWYRRGATPQQIHNRAEYHLNEPLPCQVAEDGTRIECAHRHAWNFNPDDYDVLLGHYTHAHTQQATEGRTVVFDEFPNDYETDLIGMKSALSYWLKSTEGVPFEDYTDLIENRDDQQRRGEALLWFEDQGIEPDEGHVFEDATAHADAPLAVYTLLAAEGLGNGIERADLGDTGTGVFNRETTEVSVLRPPALEYASGVVALDGTPSKRMWELALGERLNHRPVLQDEERAEYVREALNLNLVRTTEYVKPYNSADHVNTDRDAALLKAIAEKHGERPSVITTTTAEHEYDAEGVLEHVAETKHYGNVLGSNEFDDTRVGAVIGSNHYGDGYIKKWAAYAGEAVDRGDEKGADLSYSGFGDDVLRHMREHDTLQAAMRFGRDGNGAVIYIHTNTLPEWVPVAGEGRVVRTWSDGMKQVCRALEDLGEATTAAVADHPTVDVGRRQVFDHLEALRERGVLDRRQDTEDGRRVVWRDDGIHRLDDHGEVELEPVSLEDLDGDAVQELARNSIYTWKFRNPPAEDGSPRDQRGESATHADSRATTGDAPPAEPGD